MVEGEQMIPDIKTSSRREREEYIKTTFRCKNNCELCGLCHVFRGKDPLIVYADYIDGRNSFEEISKKIR